MRSLLLVVTAGCMSLAQPKPPERPWRSKAEDCSPSYGYSAAAGAFAAASLGVGWVLWTTDAPKPNEIAEFHFGRAAAIPLFGISIIEGLDAIYAASTTGDCREYQRFADSPDQGRVKTAPSEI